MKLPNPYLDQGVKGNGVTTWAAPPAEPRPLLGSNGRRGQGGHSEGLQVDVASHKGVARIRVIEVPVCVCVSQGVGSIKVSEVPVCVCV